MAWARLDDQFFFNPKVIGAGRDGRDCYIASLTYSTGQLTDGLVPEGVLPLLGAMAGVTDIEGAADALVRAGLWEPCEGGYRIHDFHDYNPSAEQVRAVREARAEAGRMGATKRWDNKPDGKPIANPMANAMANVWQNDAPSPSPAPSPIPSPGPDPAVGSEQRPPRDPIMAALDHAGIIISSDLHSEQWREIANMAGVDVFVEALAEAARSKPGLPSAKYVRAIIQRCLSEGRRPGARASPMPSHIPDPVPEEDPKESAELMTYTERYSAEMDDLDNVEANLDRVFALWSATDLPKWAMLQRLHDARAATREAVAAGKVNGQRMAYLFTVLEGKLGLKVPDTP